MIIGIKDLKISCIIGILPHERKEKQELLMDIEIQIKRDLEDNIYSTYDYRLFKKICQKIAKGKMNLIETFAEKLLQELLNTPSIFYAKCTIKKKSAEPDSDYAYVSLERGRA
ncbi:MAG TPA: dihydroneopterin aldolase [Chlamydiales bacterium]|nr:dihydroneopterin aldolase [Chlamydiales bacterium]